MGAPKDNQFWKLRNKHGRTRLWDDAEELWGAACDYFEWVDKHPWKEKKPITLSKGEGLGSEITDHTVRHKTPYSLKGLCVFLGCGEAQIRNFKNTLEFQKLSAAAAKDFQSVIEQIENVIFTQQYDGVAAGFFRANIISHALGVVTKTDVTSGGKPIKTAPSTIKVEIVKNKDADEDDDD